MVEKIKTIFGIVLLVGLVALLIYVLVTPVKKVETDEDTKTERLEKVDSNDNIKIYVDEETGVNYLIYDGYREAWITPRFNPDGSLYVE